MNYQIEFDSSISLDELKLFLKLDAEVKFQVVELCKLRSPTKGFVNDENFIKYLTAMLRENISPKTKKIRLKRTV